MKLQSMVLSALMALASFSYAANQHLHPQASQADQQKMTSKGLTYPGYCEIEVINSSYHDLVVSGQFDDWSYLDTFRIYAGDAPHYIDLFYHGYCHSGMNLNVQTLDGYYVYSQYTRTGETVRLVPGYLKGIKAEVKPKA
jgi:hypothetical protein